MSLPPLSSSKIDYHSLGLPFVKVTSKMTITGSKRAQFCDGLGFVVFVVALMLWSWSCSTDCQKTFKTVVRVSGCMIALFVNAAKVYSSVCIVCQEILVK